LLISLVSGSSITAAEDFTPHPENSICITGHRAKGIKPYRRKPEYQRLTASAVQFMLFRYIDMACEAGFTTFFDGLAPGTDLWAAQYILRKKSQGRNIQLIGVMPFLRHADLFPRQERSLLAEIERGCDQLVITCSDPELVYDKRGAGSGLYRDRNYFMADNSSAVIAFLNRDARFSGTQQTVNRAERSDKRILRFGCDDIHDIIDQTGTQLPDICREIACIPNFFQLFESE
jgi:uncharacterized phage-like protein YoqJ